MKSCFTPLVPCLRNFTCKMCHNYFGSLVQKKKKKKLIKLQKLLDITHKVLNKRRASSLGSQLSSDEVSVKRKTGCALAWSNFYFQVQKGVVMRGGCLNFHSVESLLSIMASEDSIVWMKLWRENSPRATLAGASNLNMYVVLLDTRCQASCAP